MNKLILTILLFSPTALAVDYLEVERLATDISCKLNSLTCVPFVEPESHNSIGNIYTVDGRAMPPDALQNDEQQRQMLPANLYVKQDGSVAQLYDVDIAALKSAAQADMSKKNAVLPVKNFALPPAISGTKEKLIITTGEAQ